MIVHGTCFYLVIFKLLFFNIGWYFRYSLVLIAMYNGWDLIGRYIPLIKCIKLKSRKGLMIGILTRFLLIPAFYFTAKYGDQGWMIMLTSFLGLTNGYFTVCVLTEAPKGYKVSWFRQFLVEFLLKSGIDLPYGILVM